MLAANTKYCGATSNVAVAMSVSSTSFIVRADLKLTVIDASGGRTTYTKGEVAPGTAVQVTEDAQTVEYVVKKYGRYTLGGWRIGLPNAPGGLLVYEFPLKSMPEGAWLDVWVSLPEDTNFGSAGGLCGQGEGSPKCKGRPRIPNAKCDESDCLPVWPDDAIFPEADLKEMESLFYNKSSTRTADRAFARGRGTTKRPARTVAPTTASASST